MATDDSSIGDDEVEQRRRFGRWLRDRIDERRLTQSEFARRAGITAGVVSQWVHGQRGPTPRSIKIIAEALRVPLNDVFAAAGVAPDPEDTPEQRRVMGILKRVRLTDRRVTFLEHLATMWKEDDQEGAGEPEATPAGT